MSSICEQVSGRDNREFWAELNTRVNGGRIPFSGSLALTHKCNLDCIHCYAREKPAEKKDRAELSTHQWQGILAELRDAGCLFLLLTGGEPLMRPDFAEIYSCAKRNGFLVTVFSNGILMDEPILDLFQHLPPRMVEFSLYGAGKETHDHITGFPGSFQLTLKKVDELLARGIPVGLKTVLMNLNLAERAAMQKIAADRNVRFRIDTAIFATLEGERTPLGLRVSPRQAVEAEFSDPERVRNWIDFYHRYRNFQNSDRLYICGAGIRTFHINPRGMLFPCLMVQDHGYSLLKGSFSTGWHMEIAQIKRETLPDDSPCRTCPSQMLCGYCPGFFQLENGDARVPSPYLCEIGKLRHERIIRRLEGKAS